MEGYIAILISIGSLFFAIFSFKKSHSIEKRQLEIDESRRKDEQSAYIVGNFELGGGRRVLKIENKGPGQARNIKLFLDDIPIEEHPSWPKYNCTITELAGQGSGQLPIALSRNTMPKILKIQWDDDVNTHRSTINSLTL